MNNILVVLGLLQHSELYLQVKRSLFIWNMSRILKGESGIYFNLTVFVFLVLGCGKSVELQAGRPAIVEEDTGLWINKNPSIKGGLIINVPMNGIVDVLEVGRPESLYGVASYWYLVQHGRTKGWMWGGLARTISEDDLALVRGRYEKVDAKSGWKNFKSIAMRNIAMRRIVEAAQFFRETQDFPPDQVKEEDCLDMTSYYSKKFGGGDTELLGPFSITCGKQVHASQRLDGAIVAGKPFGKITYYMQDDTTWYVYNFWYALGDRCVAYSYEKSRYNRDTATQITVGKFRVENPKDCSIVAADTEAANRFPKG